MHLFSWEDRAISIIYILIKKMKHLKGNLNKYPLKIKQKGLFSMPQQKDFIFLGFCTITVLSTPFR